MAYSQSYTPKMKFLWGALLNSALLSVVADPLITVPANRMKHTLALRESLSEHYWPASLTTKYRHELAASVCVAQSLLVRYSQEPWSLQMWDSSGTTVMGRHAGAHQARGHQELCTSVKHSLPGTLYHSLDLLQLQYPHIVHSVLDKLHPLALNITAPAISGRYCIVTMRSLSDSSLFSVGSSELLGTFSNHNTPSYATCVPDTCTEELLTDWFQRTESRNTIVTVRCTTRATVLASDVDPDKLVYAVQETSLASGPYHYFNSSRSNSSAGIFVTVETTLITKGTLLFCAFASLLVVLVVYATAIDYLQCSCIGTTDSFQADYDEPLSRQTNGNTHSPQHQLRHPSQPELRASNEFYFQLAPPVYGWDVLQCFSIPQNWKRIFPKHQSQNDIPVIDGLKCICMCWVIVAHRYMLMLVTSSHTSDVLKNRENPNYWWLFNAYPSVDIFFVIAGFLLSTNLPRLSLKKTFSVYILRYLRLAPSVIVTVWGVATAFAHLGSGPVWDSLYDGLFGKACQTSWLSSILLVPNIHHANDMCLGHLWSLAIDWQLSLVAILAFVSLYGNGTFLKRYMPLLTMTALSIVFPCIISVTYSLPPIPSVTALQRSLDFYNHYYVNTLCRAAPYCVGLLAGRLHLWLKDHPDALTQRLVRMGHAVSMGAVSAVLISPQQIDSSNVYVSALHNTAAKPVFACAFAYLIITSCHGKGGFVGWLLSRPTVGMLAKCSYCVYLTSLPMQVWAAATSLTVPTEGIIQAYMCGGDLILSVVSGVMLSLMVEMPFARLLGKLCKKNKANNSLKCPLNSERSFEKTVNSNTSVTPLGDQGLPATSATISTQCSSCLSSISSASHRHLIKIIKKRER